MTTESLGRFVTAGLVRAIHALQQQRRQDVDVCDSAE
jgi:hypothetical protein